jgi:hypothetical protein
VTNAVGNVILNSSLVAPWSENFVTIDDDVLRVRNAQEMVTTPSKVHRGQCRVYINEQKTNGTPKLRADAASKINHTLTGKLTDENKQNDND